MPNSILQELKKHKGKKKYLSLLLDPDKLTNESLDNIIVSACRLQVDFLLLGGSLLTKKAPSQIFEKLKLSGIPIILFPGDYQHLNEEADALLFLSLISGRNPEYLIGQHVKSAPFLAKSELEIIPTSYLLIDGGKSTTVSYISNTQPIPADKPEIAMATALAGSLLGHQLTYLDTGSGALYPVPKEVIKAVATHCSSPLIIGGGIKTREQAEEAFEAGADVLVIGTAFENDPSMLEEVCKARNLQNA